MTTVPFTPKGERPRTEMLVDIVAGAKTGDVLSYESLSVLLDCENKSQVQSAVNAAKLTIERETKQTLVAQRGDGYKIVGPGEHFRQSQKHRLKGRRQNQRAISTITHVHTEKLTAEERTKRIAQITALQAIDDFERRADDKYARKEKLNELIVQTDAQNERSETEIAKLKERLTRLEQGMK